MSARDWAATVLRGGGGVAGSAVRGAMLPASWLFGAGAAVHHALYDRGMRPVTRAAVPVISVGNLRVGGSGKTPFAAWLVDRLLERGRHPAVLHGGYGADEPALHRAWHPAVPVYTGGERSASAGRAVAEGCDVLVLDDAFQHRRLARDADIVLVAAEHLDGAVRLLPAGPWREPLRALERADLLVVTRKTLSAEEAARRGRTVAAAFDDALPWALAHLRPGPLRYLSDPREAPGRVCAVAGIAEPERFFRNLRDVGVEVAEALSYPDHHVYTRDDAVRIRARAGELPVATTAKDAVKLSALLRADELLVLEQSVVLEQGGAHVDRLLDRALAP